MGGPLSHFRFGHVESGLPVVAAAYVKGRKSGPCVSADNPENRRRKVVIAGVGENSSTRAKVDIQSYSAEAATGQIVSDEHELLPRRMTKGVFVAVHLLRELHTGRARR